MREGGTAVTRPEERRVARDEAVEDDAEGRGEVLERVGGVLEQERDEHAARRVEADLFTAAAVKRRCSHRLPPALPNEANHRVGERAVPLQQA